MPLKRIWIPSPSYRSGRSGNPRLLVLHTTEGSRTVESLGNYFANRANEVSSHAGADDKPNTIGTYVSRANVAWTQGDANDESISLEMCAFAAWPESEWAKHPNLIDNVAQWLAEESKFFDIPLVRVSPRQALSSGTGVCEHRDLGAWGGGHHDCGDGFPLGDVIQMARDGVKPQAPTIWYFLQDITAVRLNRGQRMYYGGYRLQQSRDNDYRDLVRGFNHPFRRFSDDDFDSPFFIDNSKVVKEIYGGWKSREGAAAKRAQLEKELGRPLRPFTELRTAAQGGVPWGCKNLASP
jgi:hypothetical protein